MTDEPVTLRRDVGERLDSLDRVVAHLDRDVQALTRRVIGHDGDAR